MSVSYAFLATQDTYQRTIKNKTFDLHMFPQHLWGDYFWDRNWWLREVQEGVHKFGKVNKF